MKDLSMCNKCKLKCTSECVVYRREFGDKKVLKGRLNKKIYEQRKKNI